MRKRKQLFLSLYRRKMNFFIFLVLVGISVLILSIIAIYRATDKTITDIANTYGSRFVLERVKDESNPDFWEDVELAYDQGTIRRYVGPDVSYAMLDRLLSEIDGITEYEQGGRIHSVMLWDYKLIEGYSYRSYMESLEHPENGGMFSAEEVKNLQYTTEAYLVRNSKNFEEFQKGSFALVEGRHITAEDDCAVMISKTLAEKNHLKVGDTLRIETDSQVMGSGYPINSLGGVDATIVGLFELTYEQPVSYYTNEYDILENRIIVDRQTAVKLDEIYGTTDSLIRGILYTESPKELEKVMEEVKALDWIDWRYYTLYKDDSEYSAGIKPLENMNTMMIVGGFLTGLLGITLIAVLMVHGTKKRTREMGILMALGISAKEIRRQVWKEYLLLTTAALCLALALGTAMLPVIGNGIYQGFRGDQSPKEYTKKEIEAAILRGDYALADEMAKDQRQLQGGIIIEALEVDMNFAAILIIAVAELLVVWFFVDYGLDKTLKQEPMEIMSMIR